MSFSIIFSQYICWGGNTSALSEIKSKGRRVRSLSSYVKKILESEACQTSPMTECRRHLHSAIMQLSTLVLSTSKTREKKLIGMQFYLLVLEAELCT